MRKQRGRRGHFHSTFFFSKCTLIPNFRRPAHTGRKTRALKKSPDKPGPNIVYIKNFDRNAEN
ncbi:hypothetical protein Hanom_Chr07g00639191 [Helianthus anomalus]